MLFPLTSLLVLSSTLLAQPSGSQSPRSIPLAKRDNAVLTKSDGSLDFGKVNSHLARTQIKYAKSTLNQAPLPINLENSSAKPRPKPVHKRSPSPSTFNPKSPRIPIELPQPLQKRRMRYSPRSLSEIEQLLVDVNMCSQAMATLVVQTYAYASSMVSASQASVASVSMAGLASQLMVGKITSSATRAVTSSPTSTTIISPAGLIQSVTRSISLSTIINPVTIAIYVPTAAPVTLTTIIPTSISVILLSTSTLLLPTITTTSIPISIPTITSITLSPNSTLPIVTQPVNGALSVPTLVATSSSVAIVLPTLLATTSSSSVASIPFAQPTAVSVSNSPASGTGSLALTDFGAGSVWAGYITIGTPPVQFLMDMDTGSSDLWIPSSDCTSSACVGRKSYNSSASFSSSLVQGATLSILYGDGSSTSGLVYTDTVSVGGFTVPNQTFGAAASLSNDWSEDPFDGLLGMAYQSISQMNVVPFFQNLISQNSVNKPEFSFNLAANNSEVYLGGMNSAHYVADSTEWYPVSTESYWIIPVTPYINGVQITGSNFTGLQCIVDTGTSVIVAPTAQAAQYWSNVPSSTPYGDGYYAYDCATPPTLSFSFGTSSTQWNISPETLNLGAVATNSSRCIGAIIGADIGLTSWVLGDAFLQNVYSTFDFGGNRVGFSTLVV